MTDNKEKIVIIGAYMPFDDKTIERLANYKSNLQIILSICNENKDCSVLIMGDFNADLERNNRFDKE